MDVALETVSIRISKTNLAIITRSLNDNERVLSQEMFYATC